MKSPLLCLLVPFLVATTSFCFVPLSRRSTSSFINLATTHTSITSRLHTIAVISPPGGVGQVAAVEAALAGETVQWLVIGAMSDAGGQPTIALSADVIQRMKDKGSLQVVTSLSSPTTALVGTLDGTVDEAHEKAVKVAVQRATPSIEGPKIAVVPAEDASVGTNDEGGFGNLMGNFFGDDSDAPTTLTAAMGDDDCIVVHHGQLFGMPPSNPNFSPLIGGPKRDYELCEEYRMLGVRVDYSAGTTLDRSNRLSVGDLAARLATQELVVPINNRAISLTSQAGTTAPTLADWKAEVGRRPSSALEIFSTEFGGVANVERLTDWLTTKWAPAVLRTYDIAAIRTGARPVAAKKVDATSLEIVWQELVNFETVVVGKLIVGVSTTGLTATRTCNSNLPGEDVLVRRLAEAASQATEKGLAEKPRVARKEPAPEPVAVAVPVTSIKSSKTVPKSSKPRPARARRSPERKRRKKRD